MSVHTFKTIVSNKENTDAEMLGAMEISILSSIAAFREKGASLMPILEYTKQVNGISSTLWGMLILALKIAEDEDKVESKNMYEMLSDQLPMQIEEILNLIEKWAGDARENACENKAKYN